MTEIQGKGTIGMYAFKYNRENAHSVKKVKKKNIKTMVTK